MLFSRDILCEIKRVMPREEYIIITGARQTGKTSILIMLKDFLERKGQNCHYLNLENTDYLKLLNKHPFNIFELIPEAKTRQNIFIDEIQYLDNPTNFLKLLYDEKRDKIKIIASGSSSFYIDKKFEDSLVGRKFLFEIYTLNFDEFLVFKEQGNLLDNKGKKLTVSLKDKLKIFWQEYITYGGYPKVVLAETNEMRRMLLEDIGTSYVKKDIVDAGIKNGEKYSTLLKMLAGQVGGLLNSQELSNTLKMAHKTVDKYLYVISKSYHAAFIRPWSTNLRKELTKMPKIYFYDLGLRNFLLGNYDKIDTRLDKGKYSENIAFREFLNRTKNIDEIKFWRTQDKKEIDFIIHDNAFEIKYNRQGIKGSKYNFFKKMYPDIKFSYLTYENMLKEFYKWR